MKYNAIVYILVITFTSSCVSFNDSTLDQEKSLTEDGHRCLTKAEIDKGLEWASSILDAVGEKSNSSLREVKSDHCWKKKYQLNPNYGALIYWDRRKNEVQYKLSQSIGSRGKESNCDEKAAKVLEEIEYKKGQNIVEKSKAANPWEWADSDIKPIFWLDCTTESAAKFRVSVATFLHELVHGLRNENCLFDFRTNDSSLCFTSPARLPPRNFAKLDVLPDALKEQKSYVDFFEQLYLRKDDRSDFVDLIDEVNGYIATTETYTLMLNKFGKAFSERREIMLITKALYYTMRYLQKLSATNPGLYKSYFDNATNKVNLKVLLDRAEASYLEWEKGLVNINAKPIPMERYFYESYRKHRTDLKI